MQIVQGSVKVNNGEKIRRKGGRESQERNAGVCVSPPTSQRVRYKCMFIFIEYTIITCKIIRE